SRPACTSSPFRAARAGPGLLQSSRACRLLPTGKSDAASLQEQAVCHRARYGTPLATLALRAPDPRRSGGREAAGRRLTRFERPRPDTRSAAQPSAQVAQRSRRDPVATPVGTPLDLVASRRQQPTALAAERVAHQAIEEAVAEEHARRAGAGWSDELGIGNGSCEREDAGDLLAELEPRVQRERAALREADQHDTPPFVAGALSAHGVGDGAPRRPEPPLFEPRPRPAEKAGAH